MIASSDLKSGNFIQKVRKKKSYQLVCAVLLLALVAGGVVFLISILPASTATVTITPMSIRFAPTYKVGVVPGNPQAGQIKGRFISYTTPRQSRTVAVTGKGHHNATQAHGNIVVSQIHLFNASDNNTTVVPSSISAGNGMKIDIDSFTATEGANVTVSAHTDVAGSASNIPAYTLDTPVGLYPILPNGKLGPQNGTAYEQNPGAFTGGTDARDYTYVKQSDIDNVSNPLVAQLTTQAQQKAQQQILPTEQLVQNIACSPDVTTDHKANDEASNVTINADVKCNGEVYTGQDLLNAAITAQKNDALARFGQAYQLSGDVTIGITRLVQVNPDGSALYQVPTAGMWVFQFDASQLHEIAQSIAGQSQSTVSRQLLSRKGIKDVKIATSGGFGTALPTSVTSIKLVVTRIPGFTQKLILPVFP